MYEPLLGDKLMQEFMRNFLKKKPSTARDFRLTAVFNVRLPQTQTVV